MGVFAIESPEVCLDEGNAVASSAVAAAARRRSASVWSSIAPVSSCLSLLAWVHFYADQGVLFGMAAGPLPARACDVSVELDCRDGGRQSVRVDSFRADGVNPCRACAIPPLAATGGEGVRGDLYRVPDLWHYQRVCF